MYFYLFITFLVIQRLAELFRSARNEKWLISQGAIQYGSNHYPWMIALHSLFILSLVVEYYFSQGKIISYTFLFLFIALLLFKYWILNSLGRYWSTKIYRIPGSVPVNEGPYRLFRHPNYVDVVCEIAVIPLVFHLYYTAVIFSILNGVMLMVRIKVENDVWAQ